MSAHKHAVLKMSPGMQKIAWFAQQFGATAAQGRQMAEDYYTTFYRVKRPGTAYYSATCPDPGK